LLEFDEFEAVFSAYNDAQELVLRESWEQTRILAAITVQPHSKKRIYPQKLIPLPWDKTHQPETKPRLSKDEQLERMKELVQRLGDEM